MSQEGGEYRIDGVWNATCVGVSHGTREECSAMDREASVCSTHTLHGTMQQTNTDINLHMFASPISHPHPHPHTHAHMYTHTHPHPHPHPHAPPVHVHRRTIIDVECFDECCAWCEKEWEEDEERKQRVTHDATLTSTRHARGAFDTSPLEHTGAAIATRECMCLFRVHLDALVYVARGL